mgnify:CR=1 FL=1
MTNAQRGTPQAMEVSTRVKVTNLQRDITAEDLIVRLMHPCTVVLASLNCCQSIFEEVDEAVAVDLRVGRNGPEALLTFTDALLAKNAVDEFDGVLSLSATAAHRSHCLMPG